MEQAKEIFDTISDTKVKDKQKIEQALVEIRKMMGERENSWDGKNLDLNVRAYDKTEHDETLDVKEMTSQEIEQMAQFITNMVGEVNISYARVFDKKIKSYKTNHPLYKQIDDKTLGFKVNIVEFITKTVDEYKIHVETK